LVKFCPATPEKRSAMFYYFLVTSARRL